jgi:hypothetical protein
LFGAGVEVQSFGGWGSFIEENIVVMGVAFLVRERARIGLSSKTLRRAWEFECRPFYAGVGPGDASDFISFGVYLNAKKGETGEHNIFRIFFITSRQFGCNVSD